jgi:Na+-transporting NADH:ubiquinone oxidoreductase subunit NqrF
MNTFYLEHSPLANKKLRINLPSGKHIDFGAKGYEDFTTHGDEKRRQRYLARHRKREDWNDLNTAGFWSRWLLWNKPTIRASIQDLEDNFNIIIN